MLMISLLPAVIKPDGTMVGHIPKHASKALLFFPRKAGSGGFCEVTGSSINHGFGLGLEIPCNYKFHGRQAYVDKLQNLIVAVQTTFSLTVINELYLLCVYAVGTA